MKQLIQLADTLDSLGLYTEANVIDSILQTAISLTQTKPEILWGALNIGANANQNRAITLLQGRATKNRVKLTPTMIQEIFTARERVGGNYTLLQKQFPKVIEYLSLLA